MKTIKRNFLAILVLTLVFGCGGGGQPTKDQLISDLKAACQGLLDKDYDTAGKYFKMPEDAPKEKIEKQLSRMLEINEISLAGIDILEEKGKFGTLKEIFPEKAARWAERAKVAVEDCYAMRHEGAEVAAVWSEGRFELIRLDDVGKL